MIGQLRGTLVLKQPPELMIDVNGVGYELQAPMSTFYKLPALGAAIILHTHLVVREDAQTLFGFGTLDERSLFRQLIKVSGIGARLALTILSGISVDGFAVCVQNEDTGTLVKLPGIGKKTAERLVIEMRDRIGDLGGARLPGATVSVPENARGEATSALIALGYKPADVTKLLRALDMDGLSTEEIIRQALQRV